MYPCNYYRASGLEDFDMVKKAFDWPLVWMIRNAQRQFVSSVKSKNHLRGKSLDPQAQTSVVDWKIALKKMAGSSRAEYRGWP